MSASLPWTDRLLGEPACSPTPAGSWLASCGDNVGPPGERRTELELDWAAFRRLLWLLTAAAPVGELVAATI